MHTQIPLGLKLGRAQERITILRRLLLDALHAEAEAANVRADLERQIRERVRLIAAIEQRQCMVRDIVEAQRRMEPPNNF